jgi:hypothetical protein
MFFLISILNTVYIRIDKTYDMHQPVRRAGTKSKDIHVDIFARDKGRSAMKEGYLILRVSAQTILVGQSIGRRDVTETDSCSGIEGK